MATSREPSFIQPPRRTGPGRERPSPRPTSRDSETGRAHAASPQDSRRGPPERTEGFRPSSAERKPARAAASEALIADNDFPCREDQLGFRSRAQAFRAFLERVEPPMTLVVDGPAGCGKSSYMQILQLLIEQSGRIAPVWINAMHYDQETSLLASIIQQVARDHGLTAAASPALRRFRQSVEGLDRASDVGLRAEDTRIECWQECYLQVVADVLARRRSRQLVLFVDDLDACAPSSARRLLQDLFTVTQIPGSCVTWVLGLDALRFTRRSGTSEQELAKYVNLQVGVPPRVKLLGLLERHAMTLGLPDLRGVLEPLSKLLEDCGLTNPRRAKRCAARLAYLKTYGKLPRAAVPLVIGLVVIYEHYPDVFHSFERDGQATVKALREAGLGFGKATYTTANVSLMLKTFGEPVRALADVESFRELLGRVGVTSGFNGSSQDAGVARRQAFEAALVSVRQLF